MKKIILDKKWVLSGAKYDNIPAIVPGCVHTDLRRNNLIPDYFWRDNNKNCQWIENENWTYRCTFNFSELNEKTVLIFEGLDTYATIILNGETLGETHNMFIPHSFDVSGKLKKENNLLEVFFRSPVKEVENLPKLNGAFTTERLYSRRMQCTYYWDWVDRFVTCGIFAPVYFKVGDDFHVDNTYVYTQFIDEFGAQIHVATNYLNYEKSGVVKFEIFDPNRILIYSNKQYVCEPQTTHLINISSPHLWWPNGYGNHPLYTLRISVGENIHEEKFGIRTLRVAEIPDTKGGDYDLLCQKIKEGQKEVVNQDDWDHTEETAGFIVIVNGIRIYCRGANWVPCEPFPSEERDSKILNILALAEKSNMNMIRVWGGGIFEKDKFYDECDKRGLLVTQDFLMACGDYPQKEEWFLKELNKEARFAVKKLRNHPCLAWWSGDNENAVNGTNLMEDFNGRTAALVGIAPHVHELDPNRRFHLSSPYGGTPYKAITRGTTHTTNFFGDMFKFFINTDCVNYKEHLEHFLSRFIVEDPIFGMPQKSSLLRFMTKNDLNDKTETILRFHSKTNPCVSPTLFEYGKAFAQKIFGGFHNIDDKLFKYEYLQYEWIRVVFENCRRNIGFNDGMVFWMLNDCWPASMGWALIDYYNLPKAGWYSFKRCAKKVIGSLKKTNGKIILYISSDGVQGTAKIVCHTKEQTGFYTTDTNISGYGITIIELPYKNDTELAICDIYFDNTVDRCFYKDGILPLKEVNDIKVICISESSITLRASKYLHAIFLEGDYIFSDNYFTMLKDEEITINYRSANSEKSSSELSVKAFSFD